jgi:hypothetical protein
MSARVIAVRYLARESLLPCRHLSFAWSCLAANINLQSSLLRQPTVVDAQLQIASAPPAGRLIDGWWNLGGSIERFGHEPWSQKRISG